MTIEPTYTQIATYRESLELHIASVKEAGLMLGVDAYQLMAHDRTKWDADEFPYYAMKFGGGDESQDKGLVADLFARAWLHHMQNNPHHWQHWIFPDGFTPKHSSIESGVLEMPSYYALEMVADWMGASKAYTGSFDMTNWLFENMPRIRLHSKTALFVTEVLSGLGYADMVETRWWGKAATE